MPLPFFFEEHLPSQSSFVLSEETSKHVTRVLRMQKGQNIRLTDGRGNRVIAEIVLENKHATEVKTISASRVEYVAPKITIAISLIKNTSRFEWFLEKAAEIGVTAIIPLICERTEKQQFRFERMKTILISAMLQSQQAWLPLLSEPLAFKEFVKQSLPPQKYIAHCFEQEKKPLNEYATQQTGEQIILIGPEGDFSKGEVDAALQNNFMPVTLGNNRLRTETAGIVACVILNTVNLAAKLSL